MLRGIISHMGIKFQISKNGDDYIDLRMRIYEPKDNLEAIEEYRVFKEIMGREPSGIPDVHIKIAEEEGDKNE